MSLVKTLARKKVIAIHNAFDSATEKLLSEAKSIIARSPEHFHDYDRELLKAENLKKLGFVNAKNVKESKKFCDALAEKVDVKRMAESTANLIMQHQQHFPFYKFLTVDELLYICFKYNLIFAPVEQYIGEIPEKNIQDLMNIPSLDRNVKRNDIYYQSDPNLDFSYPERYLIRIKNFGSMDQATRDFWRKSRQIPASLVRDVKEYGLNIDRFKDISNALGCDLVYVSLYNVEIELIKEDSSRLYIAAPQSMFNKSLKTRVLETVIGTYDTDPVVFRRCRGGIQVITKWGLEASDPLLVNQIEN